MEHAKLSASGSARWINCPGSVLAEEGIPNTSSVYAEEGTAAHELAERCLSSGKDAESYSNEIINGFVVDKEMMDNVQQYLDYVRSYLDSKTELIVEKRVDFSDWVPGGFGTSDAVALKPLVKAVHNFDLKYGKGVPVQVENNTQEMLYSLGVIKDYDVFDEYEEFHLHIVQPRLNHFDEWVITKEQLLQFAKFVKERAELALTEDAPRIPGEKQCQWCRAKDCKALAEHNLSVVIEDFEGLESDMEVKDMADLTNDEIATLLPQLDLLINWAKGMKEHAANKLFDGEKIPGYKVVEGRSIRKWSDESEAEKVLRTKLKVSEIFSKKLITPTQAEKLLGKGNPLLDRVVTKPEGKPTLAPLSDKRPALTDISNDFDSVGDSMT